MDYNLPSVRSAHRMLAKLKEFISRHALIAQGESVIVGYSGGADSTALLKLMKDAGYDVIGAHLHHGQRADADAEQSECERVSQALGVRFVAGRANVPQMSQDLRIGVEEAGRRARYEFFRQVSFQFGGAKVATAHTLNDHVETMLLNLARGTGPAGLAGIPVKRESIIRPLLWARKDECRALCEAEGLWFHDDPANDDPKFSRAAIRRGAIPSLLKVNPQALENAARLALIVSEEDAMLDGMAAAALESSEVACNHPLDFLEAGSIFRMDASKLRHFPAALVRRGIRLLASALGASADFDQAQMAAEAIAGARQLSVTFEEGRVVVEVSADRVVARSLQATAPYRQPLTIPGETLADDLGWSLTAFETTADPGTDPSSLTAVVDFEMVKGPPYARPLEPGDKMRRINTKRERNLADLMTAAGVTLAMKQRLPVVCDVVGPIWVPAVCLAERVQVRRDTRRRLALQLGPIPTDGTV
jgi:tRNA(Ile)-lysidine synthase